LVLVVLVLRLRHQLHQAAQAPYLEVSQQLAEVVVLVLVRLQLQVDQVVAVALAALAEQGD
jgi:hypothetical protein